MSEFFESAFLSLVLTGFFFLVLSVAAVSINYIAGIYKVLREAK